MLACNTQTIHRGMFYSDQLIYCNCTKYSQFSPIILDLPPMLNVSAQCKKQDTLVYFHISLLVVQSALTCVQCTLHSPNVPDQISDKLAVCANQRPHQTPLSLRSKRCQSHNRYDHHHHGWSTSFTITTFIFGSNFKSSGPFRGSGQGGKLLTNVTMINIYQEIKVKIVKVFTSSSFFLQKVPG